MPPKRKRGPHPPSPPPEPIASSPSPAAEDVDEDENEEADHANPLPTLFNTTFALYRVSPLYLGPDRLSQPRLQTLSNRLRDTLVGDVVRGVQVGLTSSDDATLGRAGALESVDWRWVPLRKLLTRPSSGRRRTKTRRRRRQQQQREGSAELGSRDEDADEDEDDSESEEEEEQDQDQYRNAEARALSIELRYENSTFAACLLPRLYQDNNNNNNSSNIPQGQRGKAAASQWTISPHDGDGSTTTTTTTSLVADPKQFLHLPLLLLRMPAPLRTVINDFLSRTFDVRIRPLRLGTRTLVSSWEAWHADSGVGDGDGDGDGDDNNNRRQGLVKDVVLSLGFHVLDESSPLSEAPQQKEGLSEVGVDATKRTTGSSHNNNTTAAVASDTSSPLALGIKAIDIIVPAEEVRRFIRAGQRQVAKGRHNEKASSGYNNNNNNSRKGKRKAGEEQTSPSSTGADDDDRMSPSRRRKLAGGRDDEGWAWRQHTGHDEDEEVVAAAATTTTIVKKGPFTEALGLYLDRHLALNMFHPGVRVLRVACEGFVLSEGGRLKVFMPSQGGGGGRGRREAAWKLLDGLVVRARGRDWASMPVIPGL